MFVHLAAAPLDVVIPTITSLPSCSNPSSVRINPGKGEEM
jgi:hypothetical protein